MKWEKVTKDDPKVGEEVLVWDAAKMFSPKWGYNARLKNGWLHNGTITHFVRVENPESDFLTLEELNELMI